MACIHRVAHHQDEIDLLWLWDIHLLVSGMTADALATFVDLAGRTRMRAVCLRGVTLAAEAFRTPGAAALAAALVEGATAREPSAGYLGGGMGMLDLLRADLSATAGWRSRLALVSEHLFPSRAYIASTYPGWPASLLPIAYVHRIVRGAPQWLRRPSRGHDA
jgi:hypothetical protein